VRSSEKQRPSSPSRPNGPGDPVPLRRAREGHVPGPDDVSGARCLPERLLRLAGATAVRPLDHRRGSHRTDPAVARPESGNVRCAAHPGRPAGRRCSRRAQAGRPPDAGRRPGRRPSAPLRAHPRSSSRDWRERCGFTWRTDWRWPGQGLRPRTRRHLGSRRLRTARRCAEDRRRHWRCRERRGLRCAAMSRTGWSPRT
jgi:hypothetical protein